MKNVFVTYNKNSEIGENTSLRLQTLSSLYGFNVDLPYRTNPTINLETKKRINKASFVLSFSTDSDQTDNLIEELKFADSKSKPIVIAYNKDHQKPVIPIKGNNVEFFKIDFYDIDNSIKNIAAFLDKNLTQSVTKKTNSSDDGLAKILIALGIGLLAAWALSSNEE